jgi:nucleoside-diphosphate-sugar epimerase
MLRAGYYEKAVGEAMNLASGEEVKIIELANMVNELTRNPAGIRKVSRRKWDTKDRLLASINKARELIGYNPKTEFRDGLNNTITWFKENWEKIKQVADFKPGVSSAVREIIG